MVETWDVMVPEQWFVIVTSTGARIQARSTSLRTAVVLAQTFLGDEDEVMAVWDGSHIYVIDWNL